MNVLITGAAGNLGSFLARDLLSSPHQLRLMVHHHELPFRIDDNPNASVCRANLADPKSLPAACRDVDCIIHFAGILFAPRPEKFLPRTNLGYVQNLVAAAQAARVGKFILVSFPHVEGESTPERPSQYRLDGRPNSVHAQTRLAAEKHLFAVCKNSNMTPVALRAGMIYAKGVLMIEVARWLLQHRLLGVWREPTWEHLLALPDFLKAVRAAIEGPHISGIYNVADDQPVTLQEFLDTIAEHWGYAKPWRCPRCMFPLAGASCEVFAAVVGTKSPLTRDFIRIGMVSSVADTSRMKRELLPKLDYPSLKEGLVLL
ncbi:MAG TPA: NAD(P)-dependent oxidoreductase [Verrucomicrobiae bacterium]|nr:NAD(P)-dependent oxidoreductase [Verrucomicrobiae bacterium]